MRPPAIIGLALAVAALLAIAVHSQANLGKNLPPKVECRTEAEATEKAIRYLVDHGGSLLSTSGTPSMEPWLVGRAMGVFHRPKWKDVPTGKLIMYYGAKGATAMLKDGSTVDASTVVFCHILASRYADGRGIATGLHNPQFERWNPIGEDNFVGEVLIIFTWPQGGKP